MKRLAVLSSLALFLAFMAPAAFARVGFNIHPAVALEGEMSYDFQRSTTQTITSGGITDTFRSNLRLIHGLFGPKIQTTKGACACFSWLRADC